MKTISILLLFAIVATTLERINARYLLVEIDDEEESKNRTCGFEGGDCCRNKLPPEERLSTKLKIDCDPGLMCQLNWPSPTANGTCFPERSYVPELRKEGEPCGSCFGAWCPDSCKDEQCGECEKGLECKQVSQFREPPKRCKKREGPTTAEPKVEAKSVAPVKPVRHTIPLFRPTQKPVIPREACCLEKGVPRICLGICMNDCTETPDETYRLVKSDNVCNKHEPTAKECCEKEKGKVDLIKDIKRRPDFPLNFKTTDPIEILPDIVTRIIIPDELNSTLNSSSNLLKEKKLVELAKRGVCDESCCCDDCFPCAEERIAKIIEGLENIVMPENLTANDSAIDYPDYPSHYPDYDYTTEWSNITIYDYPDTTEWSNTEDVENDTSVKIASEEKVPTPRECCENAKVPDFCLGLCTLADAMARQGKRITACSKYDTIIEGCFQAAEPRIQEPETEEKLLSRSGAAVRW